LGAVPTGRGKPCVYPCRAKTLLKLRGGFDSNYPFATWRRKLSAKSQLPLALQQVRQPFVLGGMGDERRVCLTVHVRQPATPLGDGWIARLEPTRFNDVQVVGQVDRRGRQRGLGNLD